MIANHAVRARLVFSAWVRRPKFGRLVLALTIGLIAIVDIVMIAAILLRVFAKLEIDYNEGWNCYFQAAAASGKDLYPAPGGLVINNYPPCPFG